MKRLEFQGKELFASAGIPVPPSRLVRITNPDGTPVDTGPDDVHARVRHAVDELAENCSDAPLRAVAVKAQLDMGGRGKAGLIELVTSDGSPVEDLASQAVSACDRICNRGYRIPALLIEEAVDLREELYLSISVDPCLACHVVLASREGGVEIETLARERPDAILRLNVDPFRGLQTYQARGLAYDLGLRGAHAQRFASLLAQLYAVFTRYDAELVEINPVFVTDSVPELVAGDAKVIIDDNSLYRQADFPLEREQYDSDAAYEAALEGIPYLQFDGSISLMCAGAGLTTTVFDLVNYFGGSVANYLEFGGPNYQKAQRAMELCLQNRSAVILIVTFGTIARADVMAEGVVQAIRTLQPDRPVVTCIRGTNEEGADSILREAGLTPLYDTEEAVRLAVRLAADAEVRS